MIRKIKDKPEEKNKKTSFTLQHRLHCKYPYGGDSCGDE